jgi:hypothetical protein
MRFHFTILAGLLLGLCCYAQNTTSSAASGPEYFRLLEEYQKLADRYDNAVLKEIGLTDSGKPLSLFLVQHENFRAEDLSTLSEAIDDKLVILINNGIHPGESCGVEASLNWLQEILKEPIEENILIAVIPVYNIGGLLQRRPHTRANQNGPNLQGFRGNAKNLDLNRDFIKGDARNTFAFYQIFQSLQPHIFVDTHTSNGADYAYTMTLISTLADKLAPPMASLLKERMEPALFASMKMKDWEMSPYVNVFGRTPDSGFSAFLESPRYASGYTALFNTIGFITEAHMFKPFEDRVAATEAFLESLYEFSALHSEEIKEAKKAALRWQKSVASFPVDWQLDTSVVEKLSFKGFASATLSSHLGPYKRLKYYRDSSKTMELNYYPHYKVLQEASVPKYYLIPFAQREIIRLLEAHDIEMHALPNDSLISCDFWHIDDYQFATKPYEGHFRVENIKAHAERSSRRFYKGDLLVPANQEKAYFLSTVLHPLGRDSYLSWGFLHSIFGRKEYFSSYVFEDTAAKLLEENPQLKLDFKSWQLANPKKASNSYESLNFIYQRSDYFEEEYLRYPIGFIN